MTQLDQGSTAPKNDAAAAAAALLLANYSFDLGRYTANELVERWLSRYPSDWILLAAIEALYQGRYKAVSVQQILTIWHRREQPIYHFSCEFKRLVCRQLPPHLTAELIGTLEDLPAAPEPEIQADETTANVPARLQAEEIVSRVAAASIMPPATPLYDSLDSAKASSGFEAILEALPTEPAPLGVPSPTSATSEEVRTTKMPLVEIGKPNEMHIWGFSNPPIDQFTPANVAPDIYAKLKAIAHSPERQPLPQPKQDKPVSEPKSTALEDSLSGKRDDAAVLPESREAEE